MLEMGQHKEWSDSRFWEETFFRVAENFGVLYLMFPSLLAVFVCAHQAWWLDYLPETCHPTKAKYITSILHYLLMVSKQWLHQGSDTQLVVHAD